jgi:hypothetical protein
MDTSKYTPAQRLEVFLKLKKLSFDEFARLIEEPKLVSQHSKYVGAGKSTLQKFLSSFYKAGLNRDWYLTGKGEMEVNSELEPSSIVKAESPDFLNTIANIKLYNFPVHANEGCAVHFDDMPYSYLPVSVGLKLDVQKSIALRVSGQSMKDMGILNNDVIIVEIGRPPVSSNSVFCVHNGVPIVKYYEKAADTRLGFILYTMNGDKDIYKIEGTDNIQVYGVVRVVLRIP